MKISKQTTSIKGKNFNITFIHKAHVEASFLPTISPRPDFRTGMCNTGRTFENFFWSAPNTQGGHGSCSLEGKDGWVCDYLCDQHNGGKSCNPEGARCDW